ncbi:pirin family protein [Microbacterium sediminicola]|uniref:Pirin family protein n=1 Tax=Microbacterium sediminicola TaxID=415210 RepID=A0ABN2IGX4_9MICO
MTRLDAGDEERGNAALSPGPRLDALELREVPLGGIRAMPVRRALPQRDLPMVGAWCFLDRFGPQVTTMRVDPHPHIGLQTVTWPFAGEVRHRDTLGSDIVVRRGTLNLMTAGAGIAHSEYSVGEADIPLDALQLWVALPEARRHGNPAFEQVTALPELALDHGARATVVLGELDGVASPATVYTPIVGAELTLEAGAQATVPLRAEWEHALLLVAGTAEVASTPLDAEHLLYLGRGREHVTLSSTAGATVFLLGGEPFGEDIIMWWNFVGRSHEEIVTARDAWEAAAERFGHIVGHGPERIPAPPLPAVRLTRRRRRL